MATLKQSIKGRANVIWSSPLSDCNKVLATNVFAYSAVEYYMWSERFKIGDLRDMDIIIRDIMNKHNAKYSLQLNASLYLPRNKGGRGLKNFESMYKKCRIKAAINLLTTNDPRIICVKEMDRYRMEKGNSSIISEAIRYAKNDFNLKFERMENSFIISGNEIEETSKILDVKKILKKQEVRSAMEEINSSTWQGLILKSRFDDPDLVDKAFTWLTNTVEKLPR